MKKSIGYDWNYESCPLCMKYAHKGKIVDDCIGCPLQENYGMCGDCNEPNAWAEMNDSSTWKEWIQYAKQLVEQLKSLL